MRKKGQARGVVAVLAAEYPDAECELEYRNPWELLVATVLSAQCTDQRVNQVTPGLFERWPDPESLAVADLAEVENVIRPTGFFRNKARSLVKTARSLMADHRGRVPADLDALVALPGVGRKTAKVVLGEAFGVPAGIAVDTHVRRLANRIGLTRQQDAENVAAELEKLVPRSEWIALSMRLILHGRRVCSARRPRCERCTVEPFCRKVGV